MFSLRILFLAGFVLSVDIRPEPVKIACIGDSITEGTGLTSPAVESYPARRQRLVPQSTTVLRATNTVWTVVDTTIPYRDNDWIRQTNSSAGIPRFFRLFQP